MSTKLNDDLWLHIFDTLIRENGRDALFAICSVNTYWRDLASVWPLFWTNIVVDNATQLMSDAYIQRFLTNSRTAPLHITIDLPDDRLSDDDERTLKTLESFRTSAGRVKVLKICGQDYIAIALLLEAMGKGEPAPMLDSIHISIRCEAPYEDDPMLRLDCLKTSFSPAPKLRHLTLPPPPLPYGPVIDALLPSVASLSIIARYDHVYPIPILELLGKASLDHFHFYGSDLFTFYATHDLDYSPIIRLPKLKSIDVTSPGAGTDILRNVCAPSLRYVRLDGRRNIYAAGEPYWHDVYKLAMYISVTLKRTSTRSPNLRNLHLEYLDLEKPDEDYRYILSGEWFPNLEELLMKVLKITDTPFIAAADIATTLKKLELVRCKRVTASGLCPFVSSRVQGFSLILDVRAETSEEEFRGLSELCQVEVRFSSEL